MVWRRYIRDPWEELRRMEEWMDRMFRDTWMPYYMERKALPKPGAGEEEVALTVTPSVDIKEEEGKLVLAADIPGVEKEDVTINVKGDMLEISAEKKEEKEPSPIRRFIFPGITMNIENQVSHQGCSVLIVV